MIQKELPFEYPEDRIFFINFLANGNVNKFYKNFGKSFDFREKNLKRKEFNAIRNDVFKELVSTYGKVCQLKIKKIHSESGNIEKFDIDHFIPLSTNELNKNLRQMRRVGMRKVLAQSLGSNNIQNLIIACSRCNAYKKHRIMNKDGIIAFANNK